MPQHRRNKAPRDVGRQEATEWFKSQKERNRKRAKAAKAARKRNRR